MAIGLVEVKLVKAKGLQNTDVFDCMDPYVVIQYKGQERRSNVAKGQGSNPVWNEKFKLSAECGVGSGSQYKLILKVTDNDSFSADEFVGQATIYVEDLLTIEVENGAYELHPRKYSVVHADQSFYGEIEVGITFTLKVKKEFGEEEFGGWKKSNYLLQ